MPLIEEPEGTILEPQWPESAFLGERYGAPDSDPESRGEKRTSAHQGLAFKSSGSCGLRTTSKTKFPLPFFLCLLTVFRGFLALGV